MRDSWIRIKLCKKCGCRRRWVVTNSPKYHYWQCSQGHKYSHRKLDLEEADRLNKIYFKSVVDLMIEPNPLCELLKND